MLISIIQNLPMHKKSKEILGVIVRALIEAEVPSIRKMAKKAMDKKFVDSTNYSFRESLVNRIRRFFNFHKWDYVKAQLALAQFTLNRLNRKRINIHVLTDFTYLKDKWKILSFAIPIGGRAIPLLAIPVSKDAFSNLEWKSEVDLLIYAISLLLPLLPKGTVFTFDREFTYPDLMKFLQENGMYFVIRLKKTVNVDGKPITSLASGVYEDVTIHKVRANVYLKGYLQNNKDVDFYAYVSNLPKERLSWELYRERMKIEEMFRDEKTLLKLKYLSYVNKGEVLWRWLLVFLLALLNLYLISKIKTGDHRVKVLDKDLRAKKISFINYAISLAKDVYNMVLKVSKTERLIVMLEGI